MGAYSKKKILVAHPSQINAIAEAIQSGFVSDGFEVNIDTLMSGGKDISITKGNLFKAVLGMRSALKVTLMPQTDRVLFDANVGIYGQQAIPTIISMLFFWPVLITQIWGLIEQASLDDCALALAEQAIATDSAASQRTGSQEFCTSCGVKVDEASKFCSNCGTML
ncbi:MAG: zinc ribbon domain-containing protein [Prevotellaceae bacterium]|nr:zinc ribbon domain-containing protein [Prevotellaceae bacterium]